MSETKIQTWQRIHAEHFIRKAMKVILSKHMPEDEFVQIDNLKLDTDKGKLVVDFSLHPIAELRDLL